MIGIYKITSPINRVYIGSSNDIQNRFCSYRNLKCKSQTQLYRSLKKYGVQNHIFEVLEECTIGMLLERESYYGNLYKVLDKRYGLNCRLPKANENHKCMSEETKRKIGKANKGKYIGYKHNHYESTLKKVTIEQVREIKKLLLKREKTQDEIGKLFNVSRKIISNIATGKTYQTIATDINMNDYRNVYKKLSIEDIDNIFIELKNGKTQTELAEKYNIDPSTISRLLNNTNKNR